MNINPNAYPDAYEISLGTGNNEHITFSETLKTLVMAGNLQYAEQLDDSNCYIGFDSRLKGNYVGGAKYSIIEYGTGEDGFDKVAVENKLYDRRINYRPMMFLSPYYYLAPIMRDYRWTNNVEPWLEGFTSEDPQIIQVENTFSNQINPQHIGSQNVTIPYFYPITSIDLDAIVLNLSFVFVDWDFTYDGNGNITSVTTNTSSLPFSAIKPQDKTPAGEYYDAELWERGFKDTIQLDRITHRKACVGCTVTPYYGSTPGVDIRKSMRESLANWTTVTTRPAQKDQAYFAVIQETYDEESGSIIYGMPEGILWNDMGIQSYPTSFNAFYQENYTSKTYSGITTSTLGNIMSANADTGMNALAQEGFQRYRLPVGTMPHGNYDLLNDYPTNFPASSSWQSYYYCLDNGTVLERSNVYDYSTYQPIGSNTISRCYALKDLTATVASFGFFFSSTADGVNHAVFDPITGQIPNTMYRGNYDENGISDGTWSQGSDIDLPPLDDISYVPEVPGPPEPPPPSDDDEGPISPNIPGNIGAANCFVTRYVLNTTQLRAIGRYLWRTFQDQDPATSRNMIDNFFKIMSGTSAETMDYSLTLSEVISYFISLKYFPIDLSTVSIGTGENGIRVGTGASLITAGAETRELTGPIIQLSGGTCSIPNKWNSYLDYEPHTTASIYVPYCGTADLSMSMISGAQLKIEYLVDLTTGGITAMVIKHQNGIEFPIAVLNGNCGYEIMISGTNGNSQLTNALTDTASHFVKQSSNLIQGGITGLMSGASGNIWGAASAMGGAVTSNLTDSVQSNIQQPKILATSPMTCGVSSSLSSLILPQKAYVQVRRHNPYRATSSDIWATGLGSIGFRSAYEGLISSTNGMGFCKVQNPNLDLVSQAGATQEEIKELKSLLSDGIFT